MIVGDYNHISIPDLSKYRLGAGRLKGLRCIHTHLNGEPLSEEDITDLVLLGLDLMVCVQVDEKGIPGPISYANVLPENSDGRGWIVNRVADIGQLNVDFLELVQSLEAEIARTQSARLLEKKDRALLVGVTTGPRWQEEGYLDELEELAVSDNIEVVGRVVQFIKKADPRFLIRKGKLGELAIRCLQTGSNLLIINHELTPAQVKNLTDFTELKIIGIDEIAMTKGRRNFVAIITTQQANGHVTLLGVLADRQKETVRQFLEHIPKRLRKTMKQACTDMWDGYVNAVEEFGAAHSEVSIEVVIDRFHVAKNYRECVDQVRKQECRRLKKELPEPDYEELKGVMWIVRKNNDSLTPNERKKLRRLFEFSPELKLAYSFREELNSIFEMLLTKEEGKERLLKWRDKVQRSALTCFDKFVKTLNNWLDKISNYFTDRRSSGFVEGLNNKVKTTKRRCYGILRVTTLFQRLYLDLEGYQRFA